MRNVSSECNDAYPRRCALQVWPPVSLCLEITSPLMVAMDGVKMRVCVFERLIYRG